MSMVPIETLVVRFQRLVRDLSKELGKAVVLETEGTDTRIDRSIIEQLTDPLLHILRNALDHGLEKPEDRVGKGKTVQGTITMRSYSAGANVIIEISDDGAGIDLARVRAKAVAQGLIAEDAQLAEADLIDLIFRPGFSTAEKVSGVSGRGVGMDVVRRNITDIRGDVRVSTRAGEGTTFTIRLPLTLSIIDGLLVRVGTTDLILPLSSVSKCFEVNTAELGANENQWTVLDGARTPYFMLRRDMDHALPPPELSQLIRIPYGNGQVGLVVDRIVGEYQAVLKPLGELHRNDDEYSGATILGDGSVALVVDPHRMIHKRIELPSPVVR
jgi:two-component system chemotaxis sensor kinase CheA